MPADRPVSSLVLAELYEAGDDRFLDYILSHGRNFKPLLGFIERWKKDPRAWAQRLRLTFVSHEKISANHRVVFKRLFKHAFVSKNHEMMAAFMVRLDRSIRRRRASRVRYERGGLITTEVLRVPPANARSIFFAPTTHYLRRRAWRYFRRLGYRDASAYVAAISSALVRYTDDDVRAGENLLDNWGLMHALFGKSPVLQFNGRHTNLRMSQRLSELEAAPMFERHWAVTESGAALLSILLDAGCRPVRVWAIQLLRRHHSASLASIDATILLRLIDHADPDVAAFAAELLNNSHAVAAFAMATWLLLFQTRNATILSAICDTFGKHVSFDRVTLQQAVEITLNPAAPVARLGLDILQEREIRSAEDRVQIARLGAARCAAVGQAMAAYAMARLNVAGGYDLDQVSGFFDSAIETMRDGAFTALTVSSPAATDPGFWSRLLESPYDDIHIRLVARLSKYRALPGASSDSLAILWQTVLLNIHRGGRAKLSALRQISDHIIANPVSARS